MKVVPQEGGAILPRRQSLRMTSPLAGPEPGPGGIKTLKREDSRHKAAATQVLSFRWYWAPHPRLLFFWFGAVALGRQVALGATGHLDHPRV